ncbi:MAG: polysaccharide biosynthesis C-terminal domain-containing protein [Methanofollis sp.]|uniref:oligosaccharide flippase family protein n=1 Tax=Methanofollis sp. TaxID=2052835 RepID=UPI002617D92B|nr:polysaccharide biosynthesis C-terminal domain-containing protein [Methanofollis sp.]MDD4256001.1 polysaccharide biosynthesis C-terminal domain-containing protein [Methanofollis sp.]
MYSLSRYAARLMDLDPVRRQSLISVGSSIVLTVVGFVATMYFAHILGTAVYGGYALFLAYFGIFNLIGDGGFGGAAVKRISEGSEQDEYYSAFCALRIALLLVSLLAVLVVRPLLIDLEASGMVVWLLIALCIGVFPAVMVSGVYGDGMVGVSQAAGLLNTLTRVLLQVIAVFLGFGAAGLAGGCVAGMFAGGLACLPFLKLHLARFGLDHIKNLFTFSFWTFLSTSGAIVFSYASTILVGYFLSPSDVGIYQIAFQFTTTATFTTMALHTTLYPKISRWHADGALDRVTLSLARAVTYSLLLAVPVAVGGWILGDRLLYFFYGAGFAAGASALAVLLLVQVVNVFMYLQTMCLNAIDRPRESFYATGTAAVVNIVLDLALIPVLGIEGAAIATLVTMLVNAGIARYYLSKQIPVKLERGPVLHILLAAGAMALVVLLYRLAIPLTNVFIVLAAVALGGLVYGLVLLKADRGLHDEIRDLVVQLGAPWPRWL